MVTFITGNAAKAAQLGKYLSYPVAHLKLDIVEMQSMNTAEVVEHKARAAFEHLGTPVLVEDAGLRFNAFGGLPGPFVKFFLSAPNVGNEGLCRMLDGHTDRSAIGEVHFAYFDGKDVRIFSGSCNGSISERPRGTEGFGWDPIFIPEGYEETWAEMREPDLSATSMRRPALEALAAFLHDQQR